MELVLLFSLVTNFASPKGIEIKTKWLSQAACRRHKLRNFCARLNHFLGVYGKNEDCHLLRFSVLFVVVYFVFSVNKFFMEKIPKQNRLFWLFSKKSKQVILFRDFIHEKCIDRKNKVHHDEEDRKTSKLYISKF